MEEVLPMSVSTWSLPYAALLWSDGGFLETSIGCDRRSCSWKLLWGDQKILGASLGWIGDLDCSSLVGDNCMSSMISMVSQNSRGGALEELDLLKSRAGVKIFSWSMVRYSIQLKS